MVSHIQRFSTGDGPGIRTTVFLKGCPLHCVWCHNPEAISPRIQISYQAERCLRCGICETVCPQGCHSFFNGEHFFNRERCIRCGACADNCPGALQKEGCERSVEEIMSIVKRDRPFYGEKGGMTLSGGEPMAQFDFAQQLAQAAHVQKIHVCMESSGFAPLPQWEQMLSNVDLIFFDVKETDATLHARYTGQEHTVILKNLERLDQSNVPYSIRCPMIPGYTVRTEHIDAIGDLLRRLHRVRTVELVPYHALGLSKYETLALPKPPLPEMSLSAGELLPLVARLQRLTSVPVIVQNIQQ